MGAGAWPFLVGGVICLVKSDNERDLNLLNRMLHRVVFWLVGFRLGLLGGCRLVVGQILLLRETLDDKKINGRIWQKQVCDAARCLGLHARYTEVFNKY